jgi:tetratricopeptide (TPR) repeat protein
LHAPLPESATDAALERCSELEDIELELEIDEDGQLDTAPAAAAGQSQSQLHSGSADSFDLGKELSVFADEIDFDFIQTDSGDAAFSLDSSSGLKRNELDNEDTESHYSLGLAYREMGLFDEAISEFIVASHSAGRKIDCLILQGICFRELGEIESGRIYR